MYEIVSEYETLVMYLLLSPLYSSKLGGWNKRGGWAELFCCMKNCEEGGNILVFYMKKCEEVRMGGSVFSVIDLG